MGGHSDHKTVSEHWADTTTAHGWSDLRAAKSNCERYFNLPEWSVSSVVVNNNSMYLPDITLCSFNRLSLRKLKQHGIDYNVEQDRNIIQLIMGMFKTNYIFSDEKLLENETLIDEMDRWLTDNKLNRSGLLNVMGIECFPMLLSALRYGTMDIAGNTTATHICMTYSNDYLDIKEIMHPKFGLCHTMMFKGEAAKVNIAGTQGGLTLRLYSDPDDTVPEAINNYWDQGLALYFGTNEEYTPISPGQRTMISLSATETNYQTGGLMDTVTNSEPPCVHERSPMVFRDSTVSAHSSVQLCKTECDLYYHFVIPCNCTETAGGINREVCTSHQYADCITRVQKASMHNETDIAHSLDCKKERCLPLCHQTIYTPRVSQSPMPARNIEVAATAVLQKELDQLAPTFPFQVDAGLGIKSKFYSVDIYYENFDFQQNEIYKRQTIDQLMGDLGGTFGLWAGISIMTLIHWFSAWLVPMILSCFVGQRKEIGYDDEIRT